LSRGTIRHADTLLIVVEPYYRALETAGRIARLAPDLSIPSVLAVGNKLRTDQDRAAIAEYCRLHAIEIAALIPFDEQVGAADSTGASLMDHSPDSSAVREITHLADRLLTTVSG
jgi:CO dehydrogenase maturation factor